MAAKHHIEQNVHVERARRVEDDLRQRLQRRTAAHVDARLVPTSDPLLKRLAFLVTKARKRRQAAEDKLQMLLDVGASVTRNGGHPWNS